WTDDQTAGILSGLKRGDKDANVRMEYLDWKNNPREDRLPLLYALFKEKYSRTKVNLVFATDDAALKFALRYRQELFSNAPIVFSGVFPESAQAIIGKTRNITGVFEQIDAQGNLDLMLTLNPFLQKLVLLSDQTETGLASKQIITEVARKIRPDLILEDFSSLSEAEVVERLRTLPANAAVLVTSYVSDGAGMIRAPEKYVRLYAEQSNAPLYVTYDFNIGDGALGGSTVSGKLQGEAAAKLAIRILQGEDPDTISPLAVGTTVTMVDYNQLVRHNLSLGRVPQGSILLHNPLAVYEENKTIVWSIAIIFIFLIVYILALSSNIRQRKAAELDLKQKNEELGALYEEIYASQDELHYRYQQLESVQAALKKSEERYKLSLAGANDGLWDWDLVTGQIYLSKRGSRILEIEWQESYSVSDLPTVLRQEETHDSLLNKLENLIALGKTHFSFEKEIFFSTMAKWLLIRGKVLLDEAGTPVRAAGSLTDVSDRKRNEAVIHYMAFHDNLTKLANRSALNEKLAALFVHCQAERKRGCLFFLDIDNFKTVNDLFGHTFGDQLLIAFADVLKREKEEAFLARMGGDEFVLLMEGMEEPQLAADFAQEIADLFAEPLRVADKQIHLTISIGIAFYPSNGQSQEALLKNADLAMYQAKNKGKNQYAFFDYAMEAAIQKKALLETDLRAAIASGEIFAWYQPIFDLKTQKINRFEAFARWHSPQHGFVAPNDFIPLAEETGLILALGYEILGQACSFLRDLMLQGEQQVVVTVNISAVQLMQPDFVDLVQEAIDLYSIPPELLGLEITESILMQSFDDNVAKLKKLKEKGILIYLDDFGTGYSSLKYLKDLPIDVVKIDKSFVDGIIENQEDREFTHIIIRLAHLLNMKTVAEGVETKDQLALLAQYECDAAQGYLFSKPLPVGEAQAFLTRGKSSQ
nr:ABC transporter substrate binding protein [Sporomusaceae bacterium]